MSVTGITIGSGAGAGGGVQTLVPDVVGKAEVDAQQEITDAGLRVGRRTPVRAPGAVGTVLRQDPQAGEPRPLRSPVALFIIVAPPATPPDIDNKLTEIKGVVDRLEATVETDEAAEERTERILDRIDKVFGRGGLE